MCLELYIVSIYLARKMAEQGVQNPTAHCKVLILLEEQYGLICYIFFGMPSHPTLNVAEPLTCL